MRDIDTALGYHLDQISVAELIGDVPSDTENNDRLVEVAATKLGGEGVPHDTNYLPASTFAPETCGADRRTPA